MADPYLGEIRMFAGNFAPAGWAKCDGSPLPISENDALFTLIGTTYGGDGQSTFNLPDLRGRIPMHQGNGFVLAEAGGAEEVTLTINQIPSHSHGFLASTDSAVSAGPGGNLPATTNVAKKVYAGPASAPIAMSPLSIGPVGGSQPHTNFMPYLCVNFIIAVHGIFPTQN